MGKQFLGTSAGQTEKNFNANKTICGLPIPLRQLVRTWCKLNGIFMDKDATYITWCETDQDQGKEKIYKLFLNYYKNSKGKEFIIAKNNRNRQSINVTSMMAVEFELQKIAKNSHSFKNDKIGDNVYYMEILNNLLTKNNYQDEQV